MTTQTYYSPFYPPVEEPGAAGTTIAVVPSSTIVTISNHAQAALDSAAQVAADLDIQSDTIIAQMLRGDALQKLIADRTLLNGQGVNTVLDSFQQFTTTQTSALSQKFDILGVGINGNTAFQLNTSNLYVDGTKSLASNLNELAVNSDGNKAAIDKLDSIVRDPSGTTVRSVLSLDVNGYVSGTIATNNGKTSSFSILASVFQVVDPNNGAPFTPFSISNGIVKMTNVEVDTLKYSALVPLFGGGNNHLDPAFGYQIIPGGFIIQWGQVRKTLSGGYETVTFPTPFPTQIVSAMAMPVVTGRQNSNQDMWLQTNSNRGPTFFEVLPHAGPSGQTLNGFDWIAFGY